MIFLAYSLLACTTAPDSADTAVEDPAEHACEHAGTQSGTLTAGAAMDTTAPVLPLDGEPYEVTLVAGAPGYLAVEIPGDTAALLFAGTADVVTGWYNGTEDAGLPEGAPNELCADDIPEHFDLDFHTAGTWYIEVGPAAVADVWLMLASAEGHAHEE